MVCKKDLMLSDENVVLCRKFPTQVLQVKCVLTITLKPDAC